MRGMPDNRVGSSPHVVRELLTTLVERTLCIMPNPNVCAVVQLDSMVMQKPDIRALNPDRIDGKTCLLVSLVWKAPKIVKLSNNDFSEIRPRQWRKYSRAVLECRPFAKRKDGTPLQETLIADLRAQGFWVVNGPPQRKFSVYVVELDLTRLTGQEKAKVRKCNPAANPSLPGLYVGQTESTPEKRLEQHLRKATTKKGYKIFNKLVSKCGIKLRPDLYERYNQHKLSELESLVKEENLAQELRDRGYTVLGGH